MSRPYLCLNQSGVRFPKPLCFLAGVMPSSDHWFVIAYKELATHSWPCVAHSQHPLLLR